MSGQPLEMSDSLSKYSSDDREKLPSGRVESLEECKSPDVEAGVSDQDSKVLNKIYRKLDYRIIPAFWCLYFLSSFGGVAYGNALTMNSETHDSLKQTLGLTSHQLSIASSLDYVAFIVLDLPANLIMTVVSPHTWMSRVIVTVGIVYACFAAVTTADGLIVARVFTGITQAGVWPGMAYYISMWYPAARTAQRIGYYFTAAQISCAIAGLLAAGFQRINGARGYTGWQWMFITYGSITALCGITLLWWLPDRPDGLKAQRSQNKFSRFIEKMSPTPTKPLNEEESRIHHKDMAAHYEKPAMWNWRQLVAILLDPRLYPLVIMYFGVVGTGIAIMIFATTIIKSINPGLSSINLSLLSAPIWLFDFAAIIIVTPISDRLKKYRGLIFSFSTMIIIVGLFVMTYAAGDWSRYGGLLIAGFGLGPTVPICMTWASEIFGARHGDLGAAASAALVSGLGNLGSVTTSYALYSGWPADVARKYKYSNMVMVAILGASIIAAATNTILRWALGDFGDKGLIEVTFIGGLMRLVRGRKSQPSASQF